MCVNPTKFDLTANVLGKKNFKILDPLISTVTSEVERGFDKMKPQYAAAVPALASQQATRAPDAPVTRRSGGSSLAVNSPLSVSGNSLLGG